MTHGAGRGAEKAHLLAHSLSRATQARLHCRRSPRMSVSVQISQTYARALDLPSTTQSLAAGNASAAKNARS